VPVGLFVEAQEEDEFAGMLAHAMEHVAQRHGTRQATRGTTATIPLIFMAGWGCSGWLPVPAAFLASQRSAELEADVSAVQTLARAGFDPNALVRYVERVQVQPTGPTSKVYSPIPDRDERITALLATIQKLPKVDYAVAPTDESQLLGTKRAVSSRSLCAQRHLPHSCVRIRNRCAGALMLASESGQLV
jgi:predicted Zn-dependent protease